MAGLSQNITAATGLLRAAPTSAAPAMFADL